MKLKTVIITIVIALLVVCIITWVFISSSNIYYTKIDNKFYHGKRLLDDIDNESTAILGGYLLKDKNHVQFKGKVLNFLDPTTLILLESNYGAGTGKIYADKNGIYKINFLGNIKQTTGADFKMVGAYFKDKNNIYRYDLFSFPRLQKTKLPPELDSESFEALSDIWYVDKNYVYYAGYYAPQIAKMIDRKSAELINQVYIKDKDHVYARSNDPSRGAENVYFPVIEEGVDAKTVYDLGNDDIADKNGEYRFIRD